MDPVLTDCYLWLYDQTEYCVLGLATWRQIPGLSRLGFSKVLSYVLEFGRDPPASLQLLPDEPLSPAHQQGLQQQLQGSPLQHGPSSSSAVSLLREGVGSRGSGLMDLLLLRRVSSLASSTSSIFQEGGSLSTPLRSHSSYRGALTEGLRVAVVSLLCDLSQVPFLNVSLSAMAGEGRLPELFPFQGYGSAFRAIIAHEGAQGLFTGWVWVCAAGLCEDFSLLHAQLQGDEDEPEEEEEEDDSSMLTTPNHPHSHSERSRRGEEEREGGRSSKGGGKWYGNTPARIRDYQTILEATTAALQAEVQWLSAGAGWVWQSLSLSLYKTQPSSPNGNPQIPPNTEVSLSSLRPSPYSTTSLASHPQHHHNTPPRRAHPWLTQGWRNPATVVLRVCKAALLHPLPLLALHSITRAHGPQHIRGVCGGWGGLWSGAYTSIFMALYREPLLCLFSAPFVIRSRRMLLLNKTGSAGGGASAVPLLGTQTLTLTLLTTLLRQHGLCGVWSGSRALVWGGLPSLLACMVTRLSLKLLGLADSPRKRRRDKRRVEYIKHLARRWDFPAPSCSPPPSPSLTPLPLSMSPPSSTPSPSALLAAGVGPLPIEPLDFQVPPPSSAPPPPGRGLLSSRHHHQHLPLHPPPSTPGLPTPMPPSSSLSTPLTSNVGLQLSPLTMDGYGNGKNGGGLSGSTGSLGIASQPSPYVTTSITRSGPMDGSNGYDADTSNSTEGSNH